MGTIVEKGDYLNDTKLLLKESINNIGGDITNETTFREYAQELDNIYDNLPKTTGEDTNLSLTTIKGKMNIIPKGDTQQTQYQGYNLLNITNSALISGYTAKGVTFTYNAENGYVNLNGTSTANIYSCFASLGASGTQYNNVFVAGTTYYIKANASADTYGIYLLYQVQGGEIQGGPRVFGSQQGTWTCPENLIWVDVRAVVNESGTTLNNAKIYPTISKTSNVSFEPYVGGTASPNPSYPQDIEVVTGTQEVKVENKNFIPLEQADFTTTFSGQNVEIKNQTIKISGSATGNYSIMVGKNGLVNTTSTDRITFKIPSGSYIYTQFASGTATNINVRLKDENTNTMYKTGQTITLTETHTFSINILVEGTDSKNATINIMLEKRKCSYTIYTTPRTNTNSKSRRYRTM